MTAAVRASSRKAAPRGIARLAGWSPLRAEKNAGTESPALVRAHREGPLPLSYAQERLWFLDKLEPDTATYNWSTARRLMGEVDEDALLRAVDAVVARHESLRTTFEMVDGADGAAGRIHEATQRLARVEDASSLDEAAILRRVRGGSGDAVRSSRRSTAARRCCMPSLRSRAHLATPHRFTISSATAGAWILLTREGAPSGCSTKRSALPRRAQSARRSSTSSMRILPDGSGSVSLRYAACSRGRFWKGPAERCTAKPPTSDRPSASGSGASSRRASSR